MTDYQNLYEDCVARLANTQASLENETAARTASEAALARVSSVLHSHQQAADAITAGAEAILTSGAQAETKLSQLSQAIQRAKLFSSGREAVRKLAQAADLESQAAALKAEASALQV